MKLRVDSIYALLVFIIFIVLSSAFFYNFSLGILRDIDAQDILKGAVNSHDHFIYIDTISRLEADGFQYESNNDVGIAYIYILINSFLLGSIDYIYMSFLVNMLFLTLSYFFYLKICDYFNLGLWAKLYFLFGAHLIYFAQLINKDMITIFIIIFSIYCAINKSMWVLLLILPFAALVRQQLVVYIFLFIFLQTAVMPISRFWIAYIATSLFSAYMLNLSSIIGVESLGSGLSLFVYEINKSYYIGYLIFNPIRVLQFIQDAYLSFLFISPDGSVEVAKLLRVPQLLLIIILAKPLFRAIKNVRYGINDISRPMYSALLAFLLAWLMNPTINARYVMLVTPVLVLLAVYEKYNYSVMRLNRG